jgi:tetratricopeptide (TPR) repeat protein
LIITVLLGINFYALESTKLPTARVGANSNVLFQQDIPAEYARRLDAAAALSFYNALTLDALSERALAAGFGDRALRIAEQELRLFPNDDYALFLKYSAMALMRQHRTEALEWVLVKLQTNPNNPYYWALKATIDIPSCNYEDALEATRHELELNEGFVEAYRQRAAIYKSLGDTANMNVNLAKLRELESPTPTIFH